MTTSTMTSRITPRVSRDSREAHDNSRKAALDDGRDDQGPHRYRRAAPPRVVERRIDSPFSLGKAYGTYAYA